MPDVEKLSLASADPLEDRVEQLKELFPEAFSEGKVDFEKLRLELGDDVDEGRERYGLSWAGKADAIRAIQIPSVATLVPDRDASVDFDTTKNLMIEGDNLEVLKLLQKAYHGQVKMIYIDPPYNTGKDFIYPDNFREGLQGYLRYSGQVDDEGQKLSTNTETSGRYHSNWLNMMYPRLFLARNLLREDGVIFVSIDDHEVHNLRHVMDEVFGAENFIANIVWYKVFASKASAQHFSESHDHILVYTRRHDLWNRNLLPRTDAQATDYRNPDDDPRGRWRSVSLSARNPYSEGHWSTTTPGGREVKGPPRGRYWSISKHSFEELCADNRVWWGKGGNGIPRRKLFLSEVQDGIVPTTIWNHKRVGSTQDAKKQFLQRVIFTDPKDVFNTPKPVQLIQQMLRISTQSQESDIILDFFAGSGTTGDAVMQLNAEDGGNRKYILVQLPEPTDSGDFSTIADITRARLKAAGEAIKKEREGKLDLEEAPDLGFKALRLTSSNFKTWQPTTEDGEDLAERVVLHADNLFEGADEEAVLYEIMLKAGWPLTSPVEKRELGGQTVYDVEEGRLFICLADPISEDCIHAMRDEKPQEVICLDHAFRGNDELLTNTNLEMKSHGVLRFRTV